MAKCKYKNKLDPAYECPEYALSDFKEGFCIFHERRKDKDIERFNAGIKAKMEKKNYDFRGYYFPDTVDFKRQKFEGLVLFDGAEFQAGAWFEKAQFQGRLRFNEAKFQHWAWFVGAEFRGVASFVGTKFYDRTLFNGAEFYGSGRFNATEFDNVARFDGVRFQGEARFDGAEFQGQAFFKSAKFQGRAWFRRAKFRYPTLETPFEGAEFDDWVSFDGAEFHDRASFDEAKFEERVSFEMTEFVHTVSFRHADFNFPIDAQVAYRKAKMSYQREGDYYEAGYYHLKEMRARRKSMVKIRWPWLERGLYSLEETVKTTIANIGDNLLRLQSDTTHENSGIKKLATKIIKKINVGTFVNKASIYNQGFFRKLWRSLVLIGRTGHFTIDLISGYGEQPWKVILTALALVFGCAFLYYFFFPITSPDIQITGIGWGYFKDCLYFSFVTFTTLGYGDLRPMPEVWTRAVASIEAFTGAFMIALFVLCFARKWMR